MSVVTAFVVRTDTSAAESKMTIMLMAMMAARDGWREDKDGETTTCTMKRMTAILWGRNYSAETSLDNDDGGDFID